LCALGDQLIDAVRQLGQLVARSLAVDIDTARAILQAAMLFLGALQISAGLGDGATCFVLLALSKRERLARRSQLVLEAGTVGGRLIAIGRNASFVCLALGRLHFCPLPAHDRVALPLFRDGHLASDLLDLLAL
jgi:hypothetical protein